MAEDQAGQAEPASWRHVVEIISRGRAGSNQSTSTSQQVGDHPASGPTGPPTWLTIKPIPSKTTRLRDLHLTWCLIQTS